MDIHSYAKKLISSGPTCHASAAMLFLRLVIGGIFLYAGYSKLTNMEQVIPMFGAMGFSAFWAWVVAITEVVGGAAFILGTFTRLAGLLFVIIMLVAIIKVKWSGGFMAYQSDLVLLAGSLVVALCGCGKYGICPTRHNCSGCKTDACTCK